MPAALERSAGTRCGDGVSLVPSLGGGAAPSHPVVSEYHAEGVQAPAAMIRSGTRKLIVSLEDPDLLYDLAADPCELRDLAVDPQAEPVIERLRGQLEARLDLHTIDSRVRASQRDRHLVSRALHEGVAPVWDHEPRFDAAAQYIRNREDMYEAPAPRPARDAPGAAAAMRGRAGRCAAKKQAGGSPFRPAHALLRSTRSSRPTGRR